MRITTRGRYALRATLALARLGEDHKNTSVSIAVLSEAEHISSIFLEQIFFKLRKAGLVTSVRGPGGGFYFARPLEQLSLRDILTAAGEELDFVACDKQMQDCHRIGSCLAHSIWDDVTNLINDYFSKVTLADIMKKHRLFSPGRVDNVAGNVAVTGAANDSDDERTLV